MVRMEYWRAARKGRPVVLLTKASGIPMIPKHMLKLKFRVARTVKNKPSTNRLSDLRRLY